MRPSIAGVPVSVVDVWNKCSDPPVDVVRLAGREPEHDDGPVPGHGAGDATTRHRTGRRLDERDARRAVRREHRGRRDRRGLLRAARRGHVGAGHEQHGGAAKEESCARHEHLWASGASAATLHRRHACGALHLRAARDRLDRSRPAREESFARAQDCCRSSSAIMRRANAFASSASCARCAGDRRARACSAFHSQ